MSQEFILDCRLRTLHRLSYINNHQSLLVVSIFNVTIHPLKEEETETLRPHVCLVWKKVPRDLNHVLFLEPKILDFALLSWILYSLNILTSLGSWSLEVAFILTILTHVNITVVVWLTELKLRSENGIQLKRNKCAYHENVGQSELMGIHK